MPAPTQRGEIPAALAALFALKGHTPLELDEVAVPTAVIANMTDTPYMRYAKPVAGHVGVTATALNFGYALCRPGPLKVLQITQLVIGNSDTAVGHGLHVRIGTAAFVAQLDTLGTPTGMLDLGNEIANSLVSSTVGAAFDVAGTDTGSRVITVVNLPPSPVGIAAAAGAEKSSIVLTYPAPGIVLFGNDPNGIPALAVKGQDGVNFGFGVSFYGREWPLVGQ